MAEVRIAPRTHHLGSAHEKTAVIFFQNRIFGNRGVVAGPAGAGVKLCVRCKQSLSATYTHIRARVLAIMVLA